MPNWCENTLTVAGPPEAVQALVEAVADGDEALSFNKIIPMPESLKITSPPRPHEAEQAAENVRKHGHSDWYGWSIARWGTKWDTDKARLERFRETPPGGPEVEVAVYHFDTAWSPPDPIALELSHQHPKVVVHLRFEEPGMDFAGSRTYVHGDEVEAIDLGAAPSRLDFDVWDVERYLGEGD